MKYEMHEIYEIAPLQVGDKIHTQPFSYLQQFYEPATLNEIADKDFVITEVEYDEFDNSRVYTVDKTDIRLTDDDIDYVEREN